MRDRDANDLDKIAENVAEKNQQKQNQGNQEVMVHKGTPVNEAEARCRSFNRLVILWENEPSDWNTVELAWVWYRVSSVLFIRGINHLQHPPLHAFPTALYNCFTELTPYYIRQIPSPVLAEAAGWNPHVLHHLCTRRPELVFCYKEYANSETWVVYFSQQGFYSHTSLTSAIEDILRHWYDDPDPRNNDRWRLGNEVGDLLVRTGIRCEFVVGGMSFVREWLTGGGFVEAADDEDGFVNDNDGRDLEDVN
ncbi:hypothetical protein GGU10DRAFT_381214 [Lentinula aff. detonsa]|uniref:Uncharacterized protein n=1 Tax=Lentinula aff. detonsa TaxID=2804958 RepID=A0AA38NJ17_9AGAR|nr:hypothetical protein GGU10DRAFT_381214 [Lentinula aff. detonsa]